jgi:hypothetical protein
MRLTVLASLFPEAGMQLIGAYFIFLLAMVALTLGIILIGVVGIALYQGAVWIRATHPVASRGLKQSSGIGFRDARTVWH